VGYATIVVKGQNKKDVQKLFRCTILENDAAQLEVQGIEVGTINSDYQEHEDGQVSLSCTYHVKE